MSLSAALPYYKSIDVSKVSHRLLFHNKGPKILWDIILKTTKRLLESGYIDMQPFTWTDYVELVWDHLQTVKFEVRMA